MSVSPSPIPTFSPLPSNKAAPRDLVIACLQTELVSVGQSTEVTNGDVGRLGADEG